MLPDSITHLTINEYFKNEINKLPNNIIFLKLASRYRQPLENLPYGLKISKYYPITNIKLPFGCETITK